MGKLNSLLEEYRHAKTELASLLQAIVDEIEGPPTVPSLVAPPVAWSRSTVDTQLMRQTCGVLQKVIDKYEDHMSDRDFTEIYGLLEKLKEDGLHA